MKKKLSAALAAAALAVVPATAAMAQESTLQLVTEVVSATVEGNPQITVVHGVPGADGVNILADDAPLLEGVNFTDIVTTTDVAAGTYSIAVSTSDSEADAVIGPVDLTFEDGMSYAVVAHLTEAGDPTATLFEVNTAEGISAFHTAAFPAVAIVAGGEIQADDLTNGNAAQIDAPAGTELTGVGVAAAGSTELALEAGDVTIPEGERILAFAIGAPAEEAADEDGTDEDAAEDEEEVEQPESVDSGTGGLLDAGLPMWVAALMVLGALGIAAPAVASARRRS
jgi:hypothetical protein